MAGAGVLPSVEADNVVNVGDDRRLLVVDLLEQFRECSAALVLDFFEWRCLYSLDKVLRLTQNLVEEIATVVEALVVAFL